MTIVGSEATWDAHTINAQLDLISMCERMNHAIAFSTVADHSNAARQACFDRLRRAAQMLRGLQLWTTDTQQRIQIHLQTASR